MLVEDETILRLFPPLRAKWAWRGTQAAVRISGRNARRVLYGAISLHTGHRVLMRGRSMRQGEFQAFLRLLRRRYPGRAIWLVLDGHGAHTAAATGRLAAALGIELVFLPKQWSELNVMDHLWKALKTGIAANRQYDTVDEQADRAEQYVLGLKPREAMRKAGMLSPGFWLGDV